MRVKKPYKFGRIIFYSLISVSLFILCFYVLLDNIILGHSVLSNIEYNTMKSKVHQSQSILNTKVQEFEKIAKDYGIWDDCYYKAQEKDTEWFKENFSECLPDDYGVDLVLVANKDKDILNEYGISEVSSDLIDNDVVMNLLNKNYNINTTDFPCGNNNYNISPEDFPCGFKIYNKQLYILGISPILKESGKGDAQGVVIIGKKVTQELIEDLNNKFDIRMLITYDNNFISSVQDYIAIEKYLNKINNTHKDVISLNQEAITANAKILDISSKEIGSLIILESPRTFLTAVKAIRMYSMLVLSLSIILILILSLKLKKYIESPLNRLANQINQMADENKIIMIDSNGPYEIIRLANAFNSLLVKLRMKQEENIILKNSSNTDGLTFLYNKKFFLESIEKRTLNKNNKFNLLFCDIDYFKKVNDEYGHQIGDMVLKEIGSIIKKTIDGKGLAFRYGGEEFAIILDCIENSFNIAEEIRISVSLSTILKKKCPQLNITISIGIASYPEDAIDSYNLIKKADIAMYYSKKNGRNQCQIFNNYMNNDKKDFK